MILRPWRALQIERDHVLAIEQRLANSQESANTAREAWATDRQKLLDRLRAANEEAALSYRKNEMLVIKLTSSRTDLAQLEEACAESESINQSEIRSLRDMVQRHDQAWAEDKEQIVWLKELLGNADRTIIARNSTIKKLQSSGAKARSAARKMRDRVVHLEGEISKVRPPCTKPPLTDCQYETEQHRAEFARQSPYAKGGRLDKE